MKLENQRLCVEISEMGAEVTRIYDKKKGAELLWEADPLYWKRHSPVLFPNVGKTYRNTVLINGTHYRRHSMDLQETVSLNAFVKKMTRLRSCLLQVMRRRKYIRLTLS